MSARKKRVEPVAAAGNHPGEREADAGDRRGVKLQHDPRDPQADHQLHDGPHGERAGHGDLHAGPDDDDRREAAPQGVAGVQDDRPVGGHNLVHDLIQIPFEVVLIFGGDVGRDGRIDLLLRQGGWGAQEQRGQGTARRADERAQRAAP